MKRIDRYIFRETFPPFLFGLFLYVGLVLLSNLLPRAQYLVGLPLGGILKWLIYQIPFAVAQTLPVALLLGILLGFGKLARDNELLVMQASGLSPLRLGQGILLFALLLVGLSFYLNEQLVPQADQEVATIWWNELATHGNGLYRLAHEDLAVGPYHLYFNGYQFADHAMLGVRLETWKGSQETVILAQQGWLSGYELRLRNFRVFTLNFDQLPFPSFTQLDQAAQHLQKFIVAQDIGAPGQFLNVQLPLNQKQLISFYAGGGFENPHSLSYWWNQLHRKLGPQEYLEAATHFHADLALDVASFVILIMAFPLAIRKTHSQSHALAAALVLTLGYYLLTAIGKVMAFSGALPPTIGPWIADAIALGFGLWFGRGIYY